MLSLDEGMAGLAELGMAEEVVGFIRGEIEAEAIEAGEDVDGEVEASEFVDFVSGVGIAYCIETGDPVCEGVNSLQEAVGVIPFDTITVDDIMAVAAMMDAMEP